MKTIIAGSRSIKDLKNVEDAVEKSGFVITVVFSGAAPGVDKLGEEWAKKNGVPVQLFPACWKELDVPGARVKHGKYGPYNANAGFDRNQQMADFAEALVAVWDGHSGGTHDMIKRAEKAGLKVYVHAI